MDLTPRDLRALIVEKIDALGEPAAAEYFGVGEQTIKSWRAGNTLPKIDSLQKVWDESLLAQTPEMWTGNGAQVQVGLPIYKEQTGLNHVTLFANYKQFGPEKLNLIPKFRTLIDEARNDIAHKVRLLRRGSEYTVMCDADMALPIGNAAALRKLGWTSLPERLGNRWAFQRLMSWGKEYRIVGTLYRDRKTGHRAQCERGFRSPQENARLLSIMEGKVQDDGLEENGWVGTGLIRIENSVFDEMAAEAKPGGKLADIAPPQGPRENEPIGFFGRTSKQRGEDVAFCFPPGTWVFGASAKKIEDIKIGDRVMCDNARMNRVTDVIVRHYEGELATIHVANMGKLRCTPSHPILVRRRVGVGRASDHWINASDVVPGDLLHVPKHYFYRGAGRNTLHTCTHVYLPKNIKKDKEYVWFDRTRKAAVKIPRKIAITPGFCRMLGYYVAEGFSNGNQFSFAFGEREKEYIKDCISILRMEFGFNPSKRTANGCTRVTCVSRIFSRLLMALCGHGARNKRMPKIWNTLSRENLSEVVKGYWRGDGYHRNNHFSAVTVSERLAREFQMALLKMGIACNVSEGLIYTGKKYVMTIPSICADSMSSVVGYPTRGNPDAFNVSGIRETKRKFFVKVRRVSLEKYSGNVHNITVKNRETYTANGIAVHNCRRAGSLGIKVWCDVGLYCGHEGGVVF